MTLQVEKKTAGSELVLKLAGVLDYSTIRALHDQTSDIEGCTAIMLELSDLEFTDSTGIGAILDLIYAANANGVKIDFQGLRSEIRHIFETMGVFQIVKALQEGRPSVE